MLKNKGQGQLWRVDCKRKNWSVPSKVHIYHCLFQLHLRIYRAWGKKKHFPAKTNSRLCVRSSIGRGEMMGSRKENIFKTCRTRGVFSEAISSVFSTKRYAISSLWADKAMSLVITGDMLYVRTGTLQYQNVICRICFSHIVLLSSSVHWTICRMHTSCPLHKITG